MSVDWLAAWIVGFGWCGLTSMAGYSLLERSIMNGSITVGSAGKNEEKMTYVEGMRSLEG